VRSTPAVMAACVNLSTRARAPTLCLRSSCSGCAGRRGTVRRAIILGRKTVDSEEGVKESGVLDDQPYDTLPCYIRSCREFVTCSIEVVQFG
jgi:hypothetical protein